MTATVRTADSMRVRPNRFSPPMPVAAATLRTDQRSVTAMTSAAISNATPVAMKTADRPNTASSPPMAGPAMKPAIWQPETHA